MSKLSPYSALTTSRIIAHKRSGNALAYLSQNGDSFFLTFGEIVNSRTGSHFRLIAEKPLTIEEAHEVLIKIFKVSDEAADVTGAHSGPVSEILLLEVSKALDIEFTELVSKVSQASPYFPTKDIFLSYQKTRGPNLN
jgi:hypothetical protein